MRPQLLTRRVSAFLLAAAAVGVAIPAAQAASKPPPPTNLRATDVEWNEVELSWDAPLPDLTWPWYYEITNVTTGQHEFAGATQTSDRPPWLPRLEPESTYTFEISVVNPDGVRSAPSNRVTVTTLPMPHVDAPTNLEATAVYAINAYFSWDASDDPDLTYRLTNLTTGTDSIHHGTTFSDIVHRLPQPGQTYSFEVEAIDESGAVSAPSNRVTITAPTVDPLTDVAADRDGNDVTVSWSQPDYADPNRARSYYVYDNGTLEAVTTAGGDDDVQVSLPRVRSGVTHRYTVKVRVANILTEPSEPVSVTVPPSEDTTPPTAPEAVIEVDFETGLSTFRITEQSTDDTTPQSEIHYEGLKRHFEGFWAYDHNIPLELSDADLLQFPEQGLRAVDRAGNRSARVVPEFVIINE